MVAIAAYRMTKKKPFSDNEAELEVKFLEQTLLATKIEPQPIPVLTFPVKP